MNIATHVSLLAPSQKTDQMFHRILNTSNLSFVGVQRPPSWALRSRFDEGDVYVSTFADSDIFLGFAIVIEKNGAPYVWSIAVHPDYRGKSVGTQLLEAIRKTETVRRRDFIELAVKPDNPAQITYFRSGYRVRAVARGFYGEEGDGLLMRRDL